MSCPAYLPVLLRDPTIYVLGAEHLSHLVEMSYIAVSLSVVSRTDARKDVRRSSQDVEVPELRITAFKGPRFWPLFIISVKLYI